MIKANIRGETMTQTKYKCPKCNSNKIDVTEFLSVSSTYQYPDYIEIPCHSPDFIKETGSCLNCGHNWTFRQVLDMDVFKQSPSNNSKINMDEVKNNE